MLREYTAQGNPTGRQIRWHPGGGHHGLLGTVLARHQLQREVGHHQMTDRMSGTFVREQLLAALTRLALPASEQVRYLEEIGTAPNADELALELDDFIPMLPTAVRDGALSQGQALAIQNVSDYVDSFSGPENAACWETSELYRAPPWEDLRRLAAAALALLESENSQ
jgi:hypothetical protein